MASRDNCDGAAVGDDKGEQHLEKADEEECHDRA
jgi:hypothetical protein